VLLSPSASNLNESIIKFYIILLVKMISLGVGGDLLALMKSPRMFSLISFEILPIADCNLLLDEIDTHSFDILDSRSTFLFCAS
jgi:hypothetical protein